MSSVVAADTHMHVIRARITHADLEHHFINYVRQTPEYDIRNVGMNPLLLIPALFIPNSNNTILDRWHRLRRQRFYIVSASILDKISVFVSLAIVGTGLMIVAHASRIGAQKVYVLPAETTDPVKLQQLAELNGLWATQRWEVLKLILACFPAMIMWWRAFKRTSVPAKGKNRVRIPKLAALAEQNRRNKLALQQFARRVSTKIENSNNAMLKATVALLETKLVIATDEIKTLNKANEALRLALEEKKDSLDSS